MGKITKNDLILYDIENNDYYYTAFAVTHADNKELTGYFFDYKLYQFPYNKKYTPYLRIKTNSKEVVTCFGKSVNIVFKIPKDAKLDHLKIGEATLSIPSNKVCIEESIIFKGLRNFGYRYHILTLT